MDPLEGISLPKSVHVETLFPFVRKALSPEPSSNRSPDRFDIVLAELQVNPSAPTRVLDLGCGDWLLLEKLLEQHHGPAGHLEATCSYFGIDLPPDEDEVRWSRLHSERCTTCFPQVEKRTFNLTQDEGLVGAIQARAPYDLIVLANVVHELSPPRVVELFALLFSHLKATGKLIAIDPDCTWCFSPEAWTAPKEWHLEALPVEWETDAVWLSHLGADSVLKAMGYTATVHLHRRTMHLWTAIGSRPGTTEDAKVPQGIHAFKEHLAQQIDSERVRISRLRQELRRLYRRHTSMTGELLVKTLQFFSACASQCRRLEAMEELGR